MPQGDEAAVTPQQVQAQGKGGKDHDLGHHALKILRQEGRGDHERQESQGIEPDPDPASPGHARRDRQDRGTAGGIDIPAFPQNTGGPDEQHEDQDQVNAEHGQIGEEGLAQGIRQSDDERPDQGPHHRARAADDHDNQRVKKDVQGHVLDDPDKGHGHAPRKAAHAGPECKDRAADETVVDAEAHGRLFVVHARPDNGSDSCLLDDEPQDDEGDAPGNDEKHPIEGKGIIPDGQLPVQQRRGSNICTRPP